MDGGATGEASPSPATSPVVSPSPTTSPTTPWPSPQPSADTGLPSPQPSQSPGTVFPSPLPSAEPSPLPSALPSSEPSQSPVEPSPQPSLPPVEPEGDIEAGKLAYSQQCSFCHGDDGQSTGFSDPIDAAEDFWEHSSEPGMLYDQVEYIEKWMPHNQGQNCVADCAINIAAYIKSWAPVVQPSPEPSSEPSPDMAVVYAINVGSEQGLNYGDVLYIADAYFTGGTPSSGDDAIAGTTMQALYQTNRWGSFSYALPVDNGEYEISLKFAEIFWQESGKRVFDVDVEGQRLVSGLDLVAEAGAKHALDKTLSSVSVRDGQLDLQFSASVHNAKLSGLVVRKIGSGSTQPSPKPSVMPSTAPSPVPSIQPSAQPSIAPEPSPLPSVQPSTLPSPMPSEQPTMPPSNDSDNDGVLNASDSCPNTEASVMVDNDGCSSVQRGEALYVSKSCAACHGAEGQGGAYTKINNYECEKVDGNCAEVGPLAAYLDEFMPLGSASSSCVDSGGSSCASDIAQFMVKAFAPAGNGGKCDDPANANDAECLDADGDGVNLPDDVCPNTPADQVGSVVNSGNTMGCSAEERAVDNDGDKVPDVIDACFSEPGESVGITGCSGVKELANSAILSPQFRLTNVEYMNTIYDAFDLANASSGAPVVPADQCNLTSQCRAIWPQANDCKNSGASNSICMCGSERCDVAFPVAGDGVSLPEVTLLADTTGPFAAYTNNAAENTSDFSNAVIAAQSIAKELVKLYNNQCTWETTAQGCVEQYLKPSIEKLFRVQSLPSQDVSALAAIIDKAFDDGAEESEAVAAAIARALIDSRFLYNIEVGEGDVTNSNLKPEELAVRLSYFLIDSIPDEELFMSMSSTSSASVAAHADRLMASEAYKEVVWRFIAEWLHIPGQVSDSEDQLKKDAVEETKRFVYYILDQGLPMAELFDANYSFINANLAAHYGVEAPSSDWELYTFEDGSLRQGILTHASFLIGNGEHGRDVNTIFRGKVVFERLFCNAMPPPPDNAADQNEGTADRATAPGCKGCHAVVDPLGRMFDIYDDTGKLFSSAELSGGVKMDSDIDGDYSEVPVFSTAAASSVAVQHCFARQLYRFALGRDPKASEAASFSQVEAMAKAGAPINDIFKTLVTSESFSKIHATAELDSCPVEN